MSNFAVTPHINIQNEIGFGKTVLMPGDPLRAKFIAENFFENVEEIMQVDALRGELALSKPDKIVMTELSERMNRTIMERARSMRLHAGLPLQFWADAVDTAVYLINRGPSTSLDGGIPEEAWKGKKVNYSFLKPFGCEAFIHVDKENRTKLEPKSVFIRACQIICRTDSNFIRPYSRLNQRLRYQLYLRLLHQLPRPREHFRLLRRLRARLRALQPIRTRFCPRF